MGDVYRAHDARLNRDVAVKVLLPLWAGDAGRLRRFEQEARATAVLNHPNILAVYDVGTHDGQPYIVTELLEGVTLREALAGGALPVSKAVDIARQLAAGLAAAHAKGIAHRDIKPENLFLTPDGRVKILDFGLAKLREDAGDGGSMTRSPAATGPGVMLGTVNYMSPEQVRGQTADARSDIFSVGVVLFEMLDGARPFQGDSAVETMSAILKHDPPDLSSPKDARLPVLTRIVRHCLEKNPDERFQSAQDLAFALQSSSTSDSASSAARATLAGATVASTPRQRRERVAWAIAALFCLSTIGLAVSPYLRRAPATPVLRVAIPVPESAVIRRSAGSSGSWPNPLALSPDGRYLAFVATFGTTPFLWLRPLDSHTANRLGGTEGAIGPFWSPDSQSIAFFANGKLKRIGVAGGDPQTLAETNGLGGATWSREGVILLAPSVGGEGGLVRVSASGGAITPVTRLDPAHGETNNVWPHFLPDGRHFLYNIMGRDNPGIYVGSLDSPDRTQLLAFNLADPDDVGLSTLAYAAPGHVLYVRGQTLMAQPIDLERFKFSGPAVPVAEGVEKVGPGSAAFSVSGTGVLAYWGGTGVQPSQLTWRARDGTVIGRIGAPERYTEVALAPDERRIAVSRVDPGKQSAIWVLDVARGTALKITFDPVSLGPVWSPDSAAVAYGSARDGPPSLFQKAVSGVSQDTLLFKSHGSNTPTDWCGPAGGQSILFVAGAEKTQSDVWMLPLTGERQPIPLLRAPANEVDGHCSPDGRWLAYSSDESGRQEIYVTSFPMPGGKWPISTGGGTQPRWRRDGTELFYLAPDRTMMAVPIPVPGAFDAEAPRRLFQSPYFPIGDINISQSYDVTADGMRFLAAAADPGSPQSPLTVITR